MPEIPEQGTGNAEPPFGRNQTGVNASSADESGVGDTLRQEASSWADEAKHQGKRMLNEQKGQVAEQIAGVAKALHQSAEQYQQQDGQQVAGRVLRQAAGGLDQLSDLLRNGDADAVLERTSRLMREQPALFMGGAVAVGFMLSRFLKSSTDHDYGSSGSFSEDLGANTDTMPGDHLSDSESVTSSEWGE